LELDQKVLAERVKEELKIGELLKIKSTFSFYFFKFGKLNYSQTQTLT